MNETPAFSVVELRRYTVRPGERERFATCFETWFPEAFQQIGAVALGQFFEMADDLAFTWIRGFPDMEARLRANTSFYDGPVWMEHRATMNSLMTDSDNVLLLRALTPEQAIPMLPGTDPSANGAQPQGFLLAQIFDVQPGAVSELRDRSENVFASYRKAGAREMGVLASVEEENNFPRHPIRTDGPHLVWLGMAKDVAAAERSIGPALDEGASTLFDSGLLRQRPETIVLCPTRRSRLRWLPEWQ